MSEFRDVFSVGFNENGEADFRVRPSAFVGIECKAMNELRAMIVTAIEIMGQMWAVENAKRMPVAGCVTPTNAQVAPSLWEQTGVMQARPGER